VALGTSSRRRRLSECSSSRSSTSPECECAFGGSGSAAVMSSFSRLLQTYVLGRLCGARRRRATRGASFRPGRSRRGRGAGFFGPFPAYSTRTRLARDGHGLLPAHTPHARRERGGRSAHAGSPLEMRWRRRRARASRTASLAAVAGIATASLAAAGLLHVLAARRARIRRASASCCVAARSPLARRSTCCARVTAPERPTRRPS
jgi:hypothetical protein